MTESQARAEHLAEMFAAMTGLPPERVEQFTRKSNIDLGGIGQPRSRDELLERHERSRKEIISMMTSDAQTFSLNLGTYKTKSAADFPSPPALIACTPIHVHSLKAGNTYRGRLLRGTLAVQPIFVQSVQTLLEDEKGGLVCVSFYNALPRGTPQNIQSRWAAAQRIFAQGRRLAILEPFFKLAGDGSFMVRVDNPREVVWLDAVGPADADGWRAEGACYHP